MEKLVITQNGKKYIELGFVVTQVRTLAERALLKEDNNYRVLVARILHTLADRFINTK